MAEADRPSGAPLGASDDMIGSLAARVRELALRVAQLEGELEAARRRIAVYEDFDATVQDSLSAALRAANQIRERAQVTAQALAEEARARRSAAEQEVEALRIERDTLRRAIDEAAARPAARPEAPPGAAIPVAEMRSAAAEALRGVFKELVDEIRASTPAPPAAQAQTPPVAPATMPAEVAPSPPAYAAPLPAAPSAPVAPAAQRPPPPPPPPVASVTAAVPSAPPLSAPSFPSVVEDEEVTPADPRMSAISQLPIPAAPSQQVAPPQPSPPEAPPTWPTVAAEPVGEVQLVLSPIASFPRLVEIERRLQGMPVVRTVYARDFRNGVATLAIGLRHPMTVEEFATAVTSLEYPRLRVLSTTGYVLELRIDTEASIA